MKFGIDGFRPLYKNFCVFGMSDVFRKAVEGQEASESANCVLTYGYVDHNNGLMLEVLACAFMAEENKISYKPVSDDKRITVELSDVKDQIFEFAGYGNAPIADQFKNKLAAVAGFGANADYEQIRSMQWLDEYRYNQFIDDVLVQITSAGKAIDKAFVRMEKVGNQCIIGELLQDAKKAGYYKGDQVSLYMEESSTGTGKLVVDITPQNPISKSELEDGSKLSSAISKFMNDKTQDNMIAMLELLIDSEVMVPGVAALSIEDQKRLAAAKMVYENDMQKVKAVFKNKDKLELAPAIMTKDEKSYFPVFLATNEMEKYDERFARMKIPFVQILQTAIKAQNSIEGIIINPFSQAVVLSKDIIAVASKMKSNIL